MEDDRFDPWRYLGPVRGLELIRRILREGSYELTPHATEELAKDDLEHIDCVNVLLAGSIDEMRSGDSSPDPGLEGCRYAVCTRRIMVIVEITAPTELVVVTAWRLER